MFRIALICLTACLFTKYAHAQSPYEQLIPTQSDWTNNILVEVDYENAKQSETTANSTATEEKEENPAKVTTASYLEDNKPLLEQTSYSAPSKKSKRRWSGNVEATSLSPTIVGGEVNYLYASPISSPKIVGSEEVELDANAASRLTLSVSENDYRIVARSWQMESAKNSIGFTPTETGTDGSVSGTIRNQFEASNLDLEVARDFETNGNRKTLSLGMRLANIRTTQNLNLGYNNPLVYILDTFTTASDMSGAGITSSFSGRKRTYPRSDVYFVYNVRGSLIWGEMKNHVEGDIVHEDKLSNIKTIDSYAAREEVDDMAYIIESQFGLQYNYALKKSDANAFFRLLIEIQHWGADIGGVSTPIISHGNAVAEGIKADLIGLTIGTGFEW